MAQHSHEPAPKPPQAGKPAPRQEDRLFSLDSMITCPGCGFVYDTRFLAECCRMVDEEGYRCQNCNALLVGL
jgi:hypothetical protein